MSTEDVINKIRYDCSVRLKELLLARSLAAEKEGAPPELYLCRSWVVMIFAHCEGMVKYSSQLFINHRKKLWLKTDCIYLYGIYALVHKGDHRSIFKDTDRSRDFGIYDKITSGEKVGDALNIVMGNKGLDSKYLSILSNDILGLSIDILKYVNDITNICKFRNKIAHGDETSELDVKFCTRLHEKAVQFIHEFSDAVCDRLAQL